MKSTLSSMMGRNEQQTGFPAWGVDWVLFDSSSGWRSPHRSWLRKVRNVNRNTSTDLRKAEDNSEIIDIWLWNALIFLPEDLPT